MKRGIAVAYVALLFASAIAADGPSFRFLSRGMYYYPATRALSFPYSSCQVTNLDIKVSKCFANNLNAYSLGSYDMRTRARKVATKRITLDPPYDVKANRMLSLGEMLAGCGAGFYVLEVDTGVVVREGWWRDRVEDSCIFALTDLGISAMVTETGDFSGVVALVHALGSGKPVEGAVVTVLTRDNQVAGKGTSDRFGVARIPIDPSCKADGVEIEGVMATKGDDLSYLQLSWGSKVVSRDRDEQRRLEDVRAFLFAERDICRPGEAFETGLFLRSSPQGGMKAVPNAPIELELWDPSDGRIEQRRVTTDRWGFVAARWDIPAAAQVGNWSVVARMAGRELGRFDVNISAYVPDRFRVGLSVEGGDTNPPEFKGTAAYYFGENVRSAKWGIEANVIRAATAPHLEGWTCGTGKAPKVPTFNDCGVIEDGAFSARYSDELFAQMKTSKSPMLLLVEAAVTPPGARTVTANQCIRIDPSEVYIGVREAPSKVPDAHAFELAFLPAKPNGKVSATNEVHVKIVRNEWQRHVVQNESGSCRVEWREEHREIASLARMVRVGRLEYPAKDLASGSYTLVAETADGLETRFDFWHWEGEVSERSASPASLHLKADRSKAAPGETVTLSFNASREGLAYFAAGERGLEETGSFAVRKGVNTFQVPICKDAVSRYTYVAVTVINENAPDARRLSGMARIRVDHADRCYPIALSVPEVVRPGATVPVTVKAKGPGAVRLMAVDEGVLALTGYALPDIWGFLYDYDFGCPFALHDIYSLIYPDLKILPNGQIGGGGFVEAMKRKNVRTRRDSTLKQRETARVVLPLVEIPAGGEVTVPMTAPDFTGAMRVMAVAVDDVRAGAAAADMIVRDAASVFLNAPRCAVGGDAFEISADVFNHDLPESDWTLDVDGRLFAGRLAKGGSTNVVFTVSIPESAEGVREVKGRLTIGGETFRDAVSVTLRPKNPSIIETAYAVRPANAPAPAAAAADTGDWLRLDEDRTETCATPRLAIADALKWLEEYPYGCLEQTVSMAFPFLSADDLLRLGVIDAATRSNAVLKVKAAYGEIMQMRCNNAFAMWPGGSQEWVDGTLLAYHFIFAAERLGLLKPAPRAVMLEWLRFKANTNDPKSRLSRAYAAYILALAGEKTFATAANNILATKETDFASFLASAALIVGGHAAEGALAYQAAVAARVWETGNLPATDGWSRIRAYGMALSIMGAIPATSPDAAAPVVVKLIESLRGDGSAWGTTRDNAWACAGLARFTRDDLVFSRRIRSGLPKEMPVRADVVKVSRPFPARVKKGELVEITVSVTSPQNIERAVLCDLGPGGFELEDSALVTRSRKAASNPGRSEIRDDRWLWFGFVPNCGRDGKRTTQLRHRLRAVTRGTFAVPTLTVEDMYNPDVAGICTSPTTVTVE